MLTIDDWESLTDLQKQQDFQYVKETRLKSVSIGIALLILSSYLYFNGEASEYRLAFILQLTNLLLIISLFMVKSAKASKNTLYLFFYLFQTIIWYFGYAVQPASTVALIAFIGLMTAYLHELETSSKTKLLFFSVYCFVLMALLPAPNDTKIYLSVLMLFLTAISYSNVNVNQKVDVMWQQQVSFDLFQKHRRLLEHKIINSLTRVNYYLLLLDDETEGSEGRAETMRHLKAEIDQITKDLKNIEVQELKTFNI
ncbi:MAG: hypothetical protein OEY56_15105 [Cyclobacteriaceae bacterium]|nr:hypothetical protein [Cyclobacteriaceae bacterium]